MDKFDITNEVQVAPKREYSNVNYSIRNENDPQIGRPAVPRVTRFGTQFPPEAKFLVCFPRHSRKPTKWTRVPFSAQREHPRTPYLVLSCLLPYLFFCVGFRPVSLRAMQLTMIFIVPNSGKWTIFHFFPRNVGMSTWIHRLNFRHHWFSSDSDVDGGTMKNYFFARFLLMCPSRSKFFSVTSHTVASEFTQGVSFRVRSGISFSIFSTSKYSVNGIPNSIHSVIEFIFPILPSIAFFANLAWNYILLTQQLLFQERLANEENSLKTECSN